MIKLLIGSLAIVVLATAGSDASPADAGAPAVQASFVETGFGHTCAVTTSGSVQCWGDNNAGQLGDGSTMQRLTPTPVDGLNEPTSMVAIGDAHTCALSVSGAVDCWGYNGDGELGDDTGLDSSVPVQVVGLDLPVTDFGSGELHTCAVLSDHSVECWGYNGSGQLGDGTTVDALKPVLVGGLANAEQVDGAEDDFTCAVTTGAAAKCWGHNENGHLGNGATDNESLPVAVSGLGSGVEAISAGGDHACALMATGKVRCWSSNFVGQLGIGTMDAGSLVPVEVNDLDDVVEITAGVFHTCALTEEQLVYCWGENGSGQVGDGTNVDRDEPEPVADLDEVVSIAGGYYHTCAVREDGSVWCWGGNNRGQLGDGTLTSSNIPIEVTLATSGGVIRKWGDSNCDGVVDSADALYGLVFAADLPVEQDGACPLFGEPVEAEGASVHPWGDTDCGGEVAPFDAVRILRYVALVPVGQVPHCPAIGASVRISAVAS